MKQMGKKCLSVVKKVICNDFITLVINCMTFSAHYLSFKVFNRKKTEIASGQDSFNK